MGIYINKGNEGFRRIRNSEYVDKTELISVVNSTLFTENCFTCVSRCRRFGKSMAAKMLAAYYDYSCDSRELFADLKIANDPSFEKHLNKYPVIYLDLSDFVTRYKDDDIVNKIEERVMLDILKAYPQVERQNGYDLMDCLSEIAASTDQRFIFIIDEWDAICREFKAGTSAMDRYVNWLRRMFKGGQSTDVFAGVYMTGILPIKKYKTQSAMNNFREYSMVMPGRLAGYFGFTEHEVEILSEKFTMDYDELKKWYDGYQIGMETGIFNPNSVMQALNNGYCDSYWASTGAFETVADYIQMNFEGLKDDMLSMLAGGRCKVNPTKFQNDMSVIRSKDDVLTVLIHLGYLSFDWLKKECYVPNYEARIPASSAITTRIHWPVSSA